MFKRTELSANKSKETIKQLHYVYVYTDQTFLINCEINELWLENYFSLKSSSYHNKSIIFLLIFAFSVFLESSKEGMTGAGACVSPPRETIVSGKHLGPKVKLKTVSGSGTACLLYLFWQPSAHAMLLHIFQRSMDSSGRKLNIIEHLFRKKCQHRKFKV